jgi:hypothetical protein
VLHERARRQKNHVCHRVQASTCELTRPYVEKIAHRTEHCTAAGWHGGAAAAGSAAPGWVGRRRGGRRARPRRGVHMKCGPTRAAGYHPMCASDASPLGHGGRQQGRAAVSSTTVTVHLCYAKIRVWLCTIYTTLLRI